MTPTPASCLLLGELTPKATPGPLWTINIFKPVTLASTKRLKIVDVYILSGAGKLQAALYESSSFGWHLLTTSKTYPAVVGWNALAMDDIASRLQPAGNYMISVEGSNSLKVGFTRPGADCYFQTQWGYFPALVNPLKGYNDCSIYGEFCNY